jgi:hypothetical protein
MEIRGFKMKDHFWRLFFAITPFFVLYETMDAFVADIPIWRIIGVCVCYSVFLTAAYKFWEQETIRLEKLNKLKETTKSLSNSFQNFNEACLNAAKVIDNFARSIPYKKK